MARRINTFSKSSNSTRPHVLIIWKFDLLPAAERSLLQHAEHPILYSRVTRRFWSEYISNNLDRNRGYIIQRLLQLRSSRAYERALIYLNSARDKFGPSFTSPLLATQIWHTTCHDRELFPQIFKHWPNI